MSLHFEHVLSSLGVLTVLRNLESYFLYLPTSLPIDVNFGRLVVFGALFGMTCDAVVMAASLSSQTPFSIISKAVFQTTELFALKAKEFLKTRLRYDNEEFSEPIMVRNLFIDWLKYKIDNMKKHPGHNYALAKEFCTSKAVIPKRLLNLEVQVLEMLRRTEQFIRESSDLYLVRALIKLLERKQHNEQTYTGTQGDLIEDQSKHENPKINSVSRTRRKHETSKIIRDHVDSNDHPSHSEPLVNSNCNGDGFSEDSTFRSHNFVSADHRISVNVSVNFSLDRSENVSQLFCQNPCMLKALLIASFPQNIVTRNSCYLLKKKRYQNSEKRGTAQNYGAKVLMDENGFNPKKSVELIIKNGVKPEKVVEKLKEIINISKIEILGNVVLIEFDDILGNMDLFDEKVFKDEKGFTHVVPDRPLQNIHTVPYSSHILNMLGSGRCKFSITSIHSSSTSDHSNQYIEGPFQPYLVKWMSCSVAQQGVPCVNGKQEWRSPGGFLCDTRDTTNGVLAVVPSIVGGTHPTFAWFDGLTVLPTAANGCLTWIFLLCFLHERQSAVYYDIETREIYGLRVLNKELMLDSSDNPLLHLGDLTPIYAIRDDIQKQLCGGEGISIAKSNLKEMLNTIVAEIKDRALKSKERKSNWHNTGKRWLELSNRFIREEDSSSSLSKLTEQSEGQRQIAGDLSGGQNSEGSKIRNRICNGDQSGSIATSTAINVLNSSCNIAVENVELDYLHNESSHIDSKSASNITAVKKNSTVKSTKEKGKNEEQRDELNEKKRNEKEDQLSVLVQETESITVDTTFGNSEEAVFLDVAIDRKKSKRYNRKRNKNNGNQINLSETKERQEENDPFLSKLLEIMQYTEEKCSLKQLRKGMGKFSNSLTVNNLLKYNGIIQIQNIKDHWFVSLKDQDDQEIITEGNGVCLNEEEKNRIMNMEDENDVGRIIDSQDHANLLNRQGNNEVNKTGNKCEKTVESLIKESEEKVNKIDLKEREYGQSDQDMIDYSTAKGEKQIKHQSMSNHVDQESLSKGNSISLNEEEHRTMDRADKKKVGRIIDSPDNGILIDWQENEKLSKDKCVKTVESLIKCSKYKMKKNGLKERENDKSDQDMIDYSINSGGKHIEHRSVSNHEQCKKLTEGNSIAVKEEGKDSLMDREDRNEVGRTTDNENHENLINWQRNEKESKGDCKHEKMVDKSLVNYCEDEKNKIDLKEREHGQSDQSIITHCKANGENRTEQQSVVNHQHCGKLYNKNNERVVICEDTPEKIVELEICDPMEAEIKCLSSLKVR